jgi:phosphoadenosine phosphosulfate reductase
MEEVVLFSGGKDSLVVMDMLKDSVGRAVYVYSDMEYGHTLRYVESLQDRYDIDIIQSKVSFFDLIRDKRLCMPSRIMKWCCTVFKFAPFGLYAKKFGVGKVYRGVRGDESKKRGTYEQVEEEKFNWIVEDPILDWTEKDVWRYIREHDLPVNPLYEVMERVGCWCCPFNSKRDWRVARDLMPTKYNEFKELLHDYANDEIDPEYRRMYLKGGWTSWRYPTEIEVVGTLSEEERKTKHSMVEVEKKLNCVGCGACTLLKDIRMKCIARNYNNHRKVKV